MCINRWRRFTPTNKYLSIISELNSVERLRDYMKMFEYSPDMKKFLFWKVAWEHWQTPIETLERGKGDCEDFAIFTVDVLTRVLEITEARFIAYTGNHIGHGHAIAVFPYKNRLHIFSNGNLVTYGNNYIDIGHLFFEEGLKYMEVRDWTGRVLKRKFKVFGVF